MRIERIGGSLRSVELNQDLQRSWAAAAKTSVKVEPDAAAEADVEHLRAFWIMYENRKIEIEQTRRETKCGVVNKWRRQIEAENARYADTKKRVATRLAEWQQKHERDEANPSYATRLVEAQHWKGPKLRKAREHHQMMKAKIDADYRVRKKENADEYKAAVERLRAVRYTPREAAKKYRGSFLTKDQQKRRTARVQAARQAERAHKRKRLPPPSDRITRSMGGAERAISLQSTS
jgi:hypothetical protein